LAGLLQDEQNVSYGLRIQLAAAVTERTCLQQTYTELCDRVYNKQTSAAQSNNADEHEMEDPRQASIMTQLLLN